MCTRKGHAASVRRQSRQRLRNISRFSNRSVGAKDPLSAAADLFRGSLEREGNHETTDPFLCQPEKPADLDRRGPVAGFHRSADPRALPRRGSRDQRREHLVPEGPAYGGEPRLCAPARAGRGDAVLSHVEAHFLGLRLLRTGGARPAPARRLRPVRLYALCRDVLDPVPAALPDLSPDHHRQDPGVLSAAVHAAGPAGHPHL